MFARKTNFFCFSLFLATLFAGGDLYAAQAPNPRSAAQNVVTGRGDGRTVERVSTGDTVSRSATRRNAGPVVGRNAASTTRVINSSATGRSATRQIVSNNGMIKTRSGANVSRAGTSNATRSGFARSAKGAITAPRGGNISKSNVSRAAMSRATAVFNDISKIGGGYAACRESYATCMDQFCANANDTFRRCFCSAKFKEFRETEEALDQAKMLLAKFEDNNLNAVDKSAAEVNAMYSATVGEQAIKNDTSGAASILSEIGDLLSGKKKADKTSASLGLMDVDFSTNMDDIWGDTSSGGIFGGGSGTDMSQLEGQDLFNSSNKQCLAISNDSCENDAVLNMARSAYSIMITQDCNAYEKKINSQKEAVQQTVRQAEKYLREARLEEYRSHNSADVNECISKVKAAVTTEVACGESYKKCLDPTGAYIDTNGEPIYTPRLFQLNDLITLNGVGGDVLAQNPQFDKFLEERKMFANTALDSCRDIAATVWVEFKRSALIEISQSQDAKLEEVRMSCVNTMKECYDTQSGALKSFDDTTAKSAGALSAYAAKSMCQDKVTACAALYGNNSECKFDGNGRLTSNAKDCGLTALLSFVDNVDDTRVAEGCETAVENYLKQLCTPPKGDKNGYPWNCVNLRKTAKEGDTTGKDLTSLVQKFATENCYDPASGKTQDFNNLDPKVKESVNRQVDNVSMQLTDQMETTCVDLGGSWVESTYTGTDLSAYYSNVYGKTATDDMKTFGKCIVNTGRVQCEAHNTDENPDMAKWDETRKECVFKDKWYQDRCVILEGYFEDGICYIEK